MVTKYISLLRYVKPVVFIVSVGCFFSSSVSLPLSIDVYGMVLLLFTDFYNNMTNHGKKYSKHQPYSNSPNEFNLLREHFSGQCPDYYADAYYEIGSPGIHVCISQKLDMDIPLIPHFLRLFLTFSIVASVTSFPTDM